MSEIYEYAVIRYRPFAETGEFANIGLVVLKLSSGDIGYQLAPKRFPRIKGFFETRAYDAYGVAIDALSVELARLAEFLPNYGGQSGRSIFAELIARRESSVMFSDARVIESAESLDATTQRLFSRFVRRDFVGIEPAETILTRDIRTALNRSGIRYFKHLRIRDDVVPVQFPLAFQDQTIHAIRPLAFSQKSPLAIFDHGAHWRRRLEYLLEKRKIEEGNVLLAVERPLGDVDRKAQEAFEQARIHLKALPFDMVEGEVAGSVNPAIIDFAERVRPYQHRMMH